MTEQEIIDYNIQCEQEFKKAVQTTLSDIGAPNLFTVIGRDAQGRLCLAGMWQTKIIVDDGEFMRDRVHVKIERFLRKEMDHYSALLTKLQELP